jgi:uncharacterized membrane protein SirB2
MNLDYTTVKHLHTTAATLSIAFFLTRGAWMLWAPSMLQVRWVRIAPHAIDTILLVAGLWLAAQLPAGGPHAWLAAKVIALLVYIGLGIVALKPSRPKPVRVAALIAAVATFGYIVSVALTKSPLGFLARL